MLKNEQLQLYFPGWVHDLPIHPDRYATVLSNDYDSYYSCIFLRSQFRIPIYGYYDFESGLYLSEEAKASPKILIFVDVDVAADDFCCFGNHVTVKDNHLRANPNDLLNSFTPKAYNDKYCGSTLLFLYALYGDYKANIKQKEILLAADGFFYGLFNRGGRYAHVNMEWLRRFNLVEMLQEMIDDYDLEDYYDAVRRHHLGKKFFINQDNFSVFKFSSQNGKKDEIGLLVDPFQELCFPHHVLHVTQSYCDWDAVKKSLDEQKVFSVAKIWMNPTHKKSTHSVSLICDKEEIRRLRNEEIFSPAA